MSRSYSETTVCVQPCPCQRSSFISAAAFIWSKLFVATHPIVSCVSRASIGRFSRIRPCPNIQAASSSRIGRNEMETKQPSLRAQVSDNCNQTITLLIQQCLSPTLIKNPSSKNRDSRFNQPTHRSLSHPTLPQSDHTLECSCTSSLCILSS
jgi:hypothetical protein